jgi:hypothetical protein
MLSKNIFAALTKIPNHLFGLRGDRTKEEINNFRLKWGGFKTEMYSYQKIYTKNI